MIFPFKFFAPPLSKEAFRAIGGVLSVVQVESKFPVCQLLFFYVQLNLKTKAGSPATDDHKSHTPKETE